MLPILSSLPTLRDALAAHTAVVLEAPPGAGKTTVVPPALLDCEWLAGRKIVMLEPRRLAAKSAARFMANALNEKPGDTVGYRVRLETRVGPRTRIEVVTEGVLTRMLQDDPALEDVGLVIFDEFHERSLQADLGLALTLDVRENLRDDLRVLVMSATLDGARIGAFLDNAPVVHTEGRQFPVATEYLPMQTDEDVAARVALAARELMAREPGSLLAFLPGAGEIRRAAGKLQDALPPDVELAPLFGDLSPAEQDRAIRPAPAGRRKLVLATNIAESSLTIEGVRLVIDSGLERAPQFDPPSGMTRLVTRRISQASADQRRGRAGRMEPGLCVRLWREAETARLAPHAAPEMLDADLAPLVLELAGWGIADPERLRWLDAPPPAAFRQARKLLGELGALDDDGRISAAGRAMLRLPVHPRLGHMLLAARERKIVPLAAAIAAILEARDPLASLREADIELRLRALASGEGIARGQQQALRASARQIAAQLDEQDAFERACGAGFDAAPAGWLIAQAYPDRIAQRRPGNEARYRMAGGRGAVLDAGDRLVNAPWLAVANVSGAGRDSRIFLAAELRAEDVAALEAEAGESVQLAFDAESRAVIARRVRRVGALELESQPVPVPRECAPGILLAGLRQHGLGLLPWDRETRGLCQRVETLRRLEPAAWAACDETSLVDALETWLLPFLDGKTRLAELSSRELRDALGFRIGHGKLRELDALAPETFTLPQGARVRIDYSGEVPVLAARIQQFFGLDDTPAIANGRLPLMLHLLSPANRPMQVTRDLASFWKNTYPEVRKDLRGRYPKHKWPEEPGGERKPAND